MINHISIRNFAIIENTEIDFEDGLNIITGETGSGKSIVIEAISLALGSRADSAYVRTGKDKASIELLIDECPEACIPLMAENGISCEDNQIIIRRELALSGKNVCRINGQIVSVSFFKYPL